MNKHFDFNIIHSLKERAYNTNNSNKDNYIVKSISTNNENNVRLMKNYSNSNEQGYISFVLHTHLPYISHPEDDRIFRGIMAF